MAAPILTDQQREEIAQRYVAGDGVGALSREFSVCDKTIRRVIQNLKAKRPPAQISRAAGRDLVEFAQRAKSILWRQDTGTDEKRVTYHRWKDRVAALESQDGGGLTHNQAVVRASKEFPCLTRLFREYDVSEYDTNPESHPQIVHFGHTPGAAFASTQIICEGIEQSYRESLRWAIEAAGAYLRTDQQPTTCPCDAAWYLYRQAIEEPKDFLAKVGQIESKGDAESEERRSFRKAGQRSVQEIDAMLSELEAPDGEEEN